MKTMLVLMVSALVLVGCTCPRCPRQQTKAWEYKTVSGQVIGFEPSLGDVINREISQGWEFVSAGQAADHWGFAVLRREKK